MRQPGRLRRGGGLGAQGVPRRPRLHARARRRARIPIAGRSSAATRSAAWWPSPPSNEMPDAYAGVMLGDSTLWITDPTLRAGYAILCQGLNAAIAAGQVLDDQLAPVAQLIVQLALTAPHDPSPLPLFPPGTTNRQAYILFFSTPQPGPPGSIFPRWSRARRRQRRRESLLLRLRAPSNSQISSFNFYVANATLRDVVCSFAGDSTFVDHLASYGPFWPSSWALASGSWRTMLSRSRAPATSRSGHTRTSGTPICSRHRATGCSLSCGSSSGSIPT